MRRSTPLILITATMLLAGCAPKPPKELPPEPGPVAQTTAAPMPPAFTGPGPGSAADFVATLAGRDVIYFDTDKYAVAPEAVAALQAQAQWLLRYPAKRATIEGHCDERGTRDYNLALGERRATAARNYLVSLGVSPGQLTTVSYGKERPAAMGSTEDAWAKNRRAVTVTVD